jgi:hypothetical protein
VKELDLATCIAKSDISNRRLPNPGSEEAPEKIRELLADAKTRASTIMHEKRETFNKKATPILKEQNDRLNEIYRKKIRYIQEELFERRDRKSKLAKEWEEREQNRAKRDRDNYIQWVEDHMATTDGAHVQFVAVFYGEAI